jgi:hypothetical protein
VRNLLRWMLTFTFREMQLFLLGYLIIEICEIFTVGGFPLDGRVRRVCATVSQPS